MVGGNLCSSVRLVPIGCACWLLLQVTYLTIADFSMREELVLKIAILAEKFAPSVEVRPRCRVYAGWFVQLAR